VSDGPRRVGFTRGGGKELRRIDPQGQQRVLKALERLAASDPSLDVRRLTGSEQLRIRVGDLRVIFELDSKTDQIAVHSVLPRGKA
jgi:mRNA-degrading endonuclease RelE of RelBE toxin-antitoxin system